MDIIYVCRDPVGGADTEDATNYLPFDETADCPFKHGDILEKEFSRATVALSLIYAVMGAYVCVMAIKRLEKCRNWNAYRMLVVVAGCSIGGCCIWTMHFVGLKGMTIGNLPYVLEYNGEHRRVSATVKMEYEIVLTLLSLFAACAVSCWAITIIMPFSELTDRKTQFRVSQSRLKACAGLLAAGVILMHYMGMWAQAGKFDMVWNPWIIFASAVLGAIVCYAGLKIIFAARIVPNIQNQAIASIVIGFAAFSVHYIGCYAAEYSMKLEQVDGESQYKIRETYMTSINTSFGSGYMISIVVGIVKFLLVLCIQAYDRRILWAVIDLLEHEVFESLRSHTVQKVVDEEHIRKSKKLSRALQLRVGRTLGADEMQKIVAAGDPFACLEYGADNVAKAGRSRTSRASLIFTKMFRSAEDMKLDEECAGANENKPKRQSLVDRIVGRRSVEIKPKRQSSALNSVRDFILNRGKSLLKSQKTFDEKLNREQLGNLHVTVFDTPLPTVSANSGRTTVSSALAATVRRTGTRLFGSHNVGKQEDVDDKSEQDEDVKNSVLPPRIDIHTVIADYIEQRRTVKLLEPRFLFPKTALGKKKFIGLDKKYMVENLVDGSGLENMMRASCQAQADEAEQELRQETERKKSAALQQACLDDSSTKRDSTQSADRSAETSAAIQLRCSDISIGKNDAAPQECLSFKPTSAEASAEAAIIKTSLETSTSMQDAFDTARSSPANTTTPETKTRKTVRLTIAADSV